MPHWGRDSPLLALVALTCLSPLGDDLVRSLLALLSPLLCEWAWRCLRLGLFMGLLSQVSSLRLPSGHSGPVLTLSNVAHTSLSSPQLLVADVGVCAASLLGVTVGHVICGF